MRTFHKLVGLGGSRFLVPDAAGSLSVEQFAALPGAGLEQLSRAGFLAAAVHTRSSLANINRLIELKTDKIAGAAHG